MTETEELKLAAAEEIIRRVVEAHPIGTWLYKGFTEDPYERVTGCTACETRGPCKTLKILEDGGDDD